MHPEDQQFDQLFRDRLKDHSSPVRADLWRRVHSGIGRSRRRGFLFWPFLAAIPAACLVLFIVDPHILHGRQPGKSVNPSTAQNPTTGQNPSSAPNPPTTTNIDNHSGRPIHAIAAETFPYAAIPPVPTSESASLASQTTAFQYFHTARPTLPALAHLSIRPTVTASRPVDPTRLACPNLESGLSFFDHFYLSLFGATNFPNRYYRLSYTGGVRLTWQFTSHWSVATGLQYSVTKFKNMQYLLDSLGNLVDRSDLDLPVLIGYSWLRDNYTLTVNGGVLINLYSHFTDGLVGPAWPKHTGPSAYLDFTYNRVLTEQWSVFAEPYLRCLFSTNSPPLPARIWSTGLQVGLRYHL